MPEWSCGSWGNCDGTKLQARSCTDVGKQCAKPNVKTETQACVCSESWVCSAWSSCVAGKNTRTCTDDRKCGTIASKPKESKGCGEEVAEYVPPVQEIGSPPQNNGAGEGIAAVEQKPEKSIFDSYKFWIVGGLFIVLLIVTIVFTIHHHVLGGGKSEGGGREGQSGGVEPVAEVK